MEKMSKRGKLAAQGENKSKPKYEFTTIDYVILIVVIFVCLWSWVFVEQDTLQRSAAAQAIVKVATFLIPWIGVLERYGLQAEKLLLVHSVAYLIFFPVVLIHSFSKLKRDVNKPVEFSSLVLLLLGLVLLILLFIMPYYRLEAGFSNVAWRGGYKLIFQPWSMPLMACLNAICISYFFILIFNVLILAIKIIRNRHA